MSRYNQPQKGTTDWHMPLNDNFADLGVEVMNEVGTFADLPEPAGAVSSRGVSRKYLVREDRTIYRDAGGAWEAITGPESRTVGEAGIGKFSVHLDGSGDTDNPRTGLSEEIRSALERERSYINITGAWTMESGLSVDSTDFAPNPIRIDGHGAYIEYTDSDWAFTNDCTGNVAGQISGGQFKLFGGIWRATGSPSGFWRGIDQAFAELLPQATRGFRGSDSAIYQPEIGTQWCESNTFGGQHHLVDTGIRGVGPSGKSFQDNYIWNIQFGIVSKYGFDLSGNWIDCKFENPTVIANRTGSAMLRHNGNMGGTTFDNPEIESATADLDPFYIVEIGPDAKRGPVIDGNKSNYFIENRGLKRFNTRNASDRWTVHERYTDHDEQISAVYTSDGSSRLVHRLDRLVRETASNPNGPWSAKGSL